MRWPGCAFPAGRCWSRVVVGLLVVPLQMSLIPLLRLYNGVGHLLRRAVERPISASGWRIPASACRSRSTCCATTLPACRERSWNRRASTAPAHFEIFVEHRAAAVAFRRWPRSRIFQFLWVWNDLLVAMVFLGAQDDQIVLTAKLVEPARLARRQLGILTTSAFVTIIVPLIVFFSLQRYFVRGLLAGSVKG